MIALPPNPRYERKFVAEGRTLTEVLALVRRHPGGFREMYPARVVNNVYLDSPALGDYHDHVNGTAWRMKMRVRWYGAADGDKPQPTLELKLKQGLITGKVAHSLPAFSLDPGPVHTRLAATFDSAGLPEMLRAALRHRQPSLFNRYRRFYFVSADKRFRLTVDYALEFGRVCGNNGCAVTPGTRGTEVIIELKLELEQAEHLAPITNSLPFRLTRCSKYVLGLQRLAVG
jgi:hypothetical protein